MRLILVALFSATVAVTAWGWRVLPPETRFSFSIGAPPSVDGSLGKLTGLLVQMGSGLFFAAGGWVVADDSPTMAGIAGALLLFFLLMEFRTIRRQERTARD
ncbi:MAG: hypothetical protein ACR2KQ_04165 [Actinomycetota bacterium]